MVARVVQVPSGCPWLTRSTHTASSERPEPMYHDGIPGTFEPGYVELPLVQRALPAAVRAQAGGHLSYFTMGTCNILLGREPAGRNGETLWHLSISHPHRHPTWDEIKTARYRLLDPGLTFAMLLPPHELYVNVPAQDHVFHLWESTDPRAL